MRIKCRFCKNHYNNMNIDFCDFDFGKLLCQFEATNTVLALITILTLLIAFAVLYAVAG